MNPKKMIIPFIYSPPVGSTIPSVIQLENGLPCGIRRRSLPLNHCNSKLSEQEMDNHSFF
ncbi:hypothetical protein [Enterococcus mundtii]|uniref:hypothetical protein n=1 Tax=Enterococcus mundtii TaxID=53346 RepID=UPI0035C7595C